MPIIICIKFLLLCEVVHLLFLSADAVRVRYTVETRSFTGCLGNIQLTDSEGDTDTLLLAQASDAEGVVFHSCLV